MKKWLCVLCCAALLLPVFTCALGEEAAAEFSTATALKAFLPTVDWDDYNANGATDADTIDVYCQCMDGVGRIVCRLADIPEDADPLKVYEQINEFNLNLTQGRWLYNEEDGYVYYTQEVYEVDPESFGAYAYSYMSTAASYVYSFYERFTTAIQ